MIIINNNKEKIINNNNNNNNNKGKQKRNKISQLYFGFFNSWWPLGPWGYFIWKLWAILHPEIYRILDLGPWRPLLCRIPIAYL